VLRIHLFSDYAVAKVVGALRYKPEGLGLDFSLT
jgi:hypothetical protein